MVTIKDVAERAGVSISTVSRVVNGTAKVKGTKHEAVLKAMGELNYQPSSVARALVGNRSSMIGLVVHDLADPFFGSLARGVTAQAAASGLQTMTTEGQHRAELEAAAIRSLISRRCDGIVVHTLALSNQELLDAIGDCPAVIVNRKVPGIEDRCLWFDNRLTGYLAASHLLEKGHRCIGWIGRNEDISDNRDRFSGFCKALEEVGVDGTAAPQQSGAATAEGGYQAALELLKKHPDLTAIQAYNDVMAAGCLRALHERDYRLPDDFSVIGVDDVFLGQFVYPQLTTVRYPIEEIGRTAVRMIEGLLADKPVDKGAEFQPAGFQPQLVVRDSVSCWADVSG
ncbi:LacI family DNA-binding transcriptional regulator [Sansalvadorimonas verongulae]|uniref:LacI family DNA-binding transcriptional regulator n=1 Tax=Sansalvadorimonas verongulae TaxID=2172824 RepID=UPI0012BD3DDD|nr:LacI family DNA-binding transcriptional regulator [Sansalvadorimonas verongulae]MTI15207.1 LacI family transcriptional regulator [Sansalvadorimonas verongulae]